jgi:hypothetical protein
MLLRAVEEALINNLRMSKQYKLKELNGGGGGDDDDDNDDDDDDDI